MTTAMILLITFWRSISRRTMIFCNSDGLTVEISKQLIKKITDTCIKSYPFECGGVLIGSYSEDCLTATISEITKQKGQYKTRFFRKEHGLLQKLNKQWMLGFYYIGEWHYHPNFSPKPSATDIATMQELASSEELKCPEPILFIVGGSHEQWLFNVSIITKENRITLDKTIFDR